VDTLELTRVLARLRELLAAVRLPLRTPSAAEGEQVRSELAGQIGDYLLPRLRQMDAPLLMVVGGSTGAGKSTLVNSLVGAEVSPAGVLRPTTRAPVLAFHPGDAGWFEDDRILPGLTRTSGGPAGSGGLQLVPTERLPEGLALLDAPDIDSVVEANRALAGQLLAAADSWLFVTTAARYADAVPWDLLGAARDRGTSLSLVLDRVPPRPPARSPRTCARCSTSAASPGRRCWWCRRRRWTAAACRLPRSRPSAAGSTSSPSTRRRAPGWCGGR
jgi:hypothetical protein